MGQDNSVCRAACPAGVCCEGEAVVNGVEQGVDPKAAALDPEDFDGILHGQKAPRSSAPFITPGSIEEHYDLASSKDLGEGGFGKVRLATRKGTRTRFAIKEIRKRTEDKRRRTRGMTMEMIMNEAGAMSKLKHPNVIRMHNMFQDHVNIYLVMDFCTGGDLYDALHEVSSFSEKQAAYIMHQVLLGVNYMHHQQVAHRDLKPENFLLGEKPSDLKTCDLRIIDFGCAWNFSSADEVCKIRMGTEKYMAPEVMTGSYTYRCDNFSCGVVAYVLLCGHYPFPNATATQKYEVSFKHGDWKAVSQDGVDLIRSLLDKRPSSRFTAEQALEHTWIKSKAPRATDAPLPAATLENIKGFCSDSLMKKVALNAIANTFKEEDLRSLKETFSQLDENNDGTISMAELKAGLEKSGTSDQQKKLIELMKGMDLDGDGRIDYREFIASSIEKQQYQGEQVCWSAFSTFDIDGNGTVSRDELRQVLEDPALQGLLANKTADQVFQECDANNDGKISFEEFYAALQA